MYDILSFDYFFFLRFLVTLIHFIKGNIGCGMLAMGQAFRLGGLCLTLCILLYVWLICVYNMHILVIFLHLNTLPNKENKDLIFIYMYIILMYILQYYEKKIYMY